MPTLFRAQSAIASALTWLIKGYQRTISPDHGFLRVAFPNGICRFEPTCSQYALDCLRHYGLPGIGLMIKRIVRCHPFTLGGYDPVPAKNHHL